MDLCFFIDDFNVSHVVPELYVLLVVSVDTNGA